MFENLTKREKTLALVVGALVPLIILLMVFFWFLDSYSANDTEITNIRREIREQKQLFDDGQAASQRRIFYRSISMPGGDSNKKIDEALFDYELWLRNLSKEKMTQFVALDRGKRDTIGEFKLPNARETKKIYNERTYTLRGSCTLEQLTSFLHEFYSLDVLHRVSGLSITPRNVPGAQSKELIRTGQLTVSIAIDVLHLVDAPEERDFKEYGRIALTRSLDEYIDTVVQRNIFGPANNTPVVEINVPSRIYPDTSISMSISGDDADNNDELTFSLVNCDLPNANIKAGNGRSAQFTADALPIGEYEFQVQVTDNGVPPKSSLQDVKLVVTERPNAKPTFVTRSIEALAGESIDQVIQAQDTNVDDQLVMEILESEIPDAKLVAIEPESDDNQGDSGETPVEGGDELGDDEEGSRSRFSKPTQTLEMRLVAPAQESGTYKVKMKVSDGVDEKSYQEKEFVVTVNPPKFLDAQRTQISAISDLGGGLCYVRNRAKEETYKLKIGDSFELDRAEWTLKEVTIDDERKEVWLLCKNELRRFEIGDFLAEPREVKKVEEDQDEITSSDKNADPAESPVIASDSGKSQ